MFAILALPSTLASLNEEDNIVPEKDNAPVEFANKIMRGLRRLVTKVKKDHHASIIQAESTVKVESAVEDSMLALHAESSKAGRNERLLVQADDGFELPPAPANAQSPQEMQVTPDVSFLAASPPTCKISNKSPSGVWSRPNGEQTVYAMCSITNYRVVKWNDYERLEYPVLDYGCGKGVDGGCDKSLGDCNYQWGHTDKCPTDDEWRCVCDEWQHQGPTNAEWPDKCLDAAEALCLDTCTPMVKNYTHRLFNIYPWWADDISDSLLAACKMPTLTCPPCSEPGNQCGSANGNKVCSLPSYPYCGDSGWCGNTDAHKGSDKQFYYAALVDNWPAGCCEGPTQK